MTSMSSARASKPKSPKPSTKPLTDGEVAVEALRKKARGERLSAKESAALVACSRPTPSDVVPHKDLAEVLERYAEAFIDLQNLATKK